MKKLNHFELGCIIGGQDSASNLGSNTFTSNDTAVSLAHLAPLVPCGAIISAS